MKANITGFDLTERTVTLSFRDMPPVTIGEEVAVYFSAKPDASATTKPIQTPMWSCSNDFCREDVSWPASDLYWFEQEKRWVCGECWCGLTDGDGELPRRGISLHDYILSLGISARELLEGKP